MRPRSRLTKTQSRRYIKRRKEKKLYEIGLVIVTVAVWLFVFSRVTSISAFTIDDVKVSGTDASTAAAISARGLSLLDGSYLALFSRANSFLYPAHQIAAAAQSLSPAIDHVSVSRSGLTTVQITVTEKQPAAIVCADLPDMSDDHIDISQSSACYIADKNGLLYKALAVGAVPPVHTLFFSADLADDTSSSTSLVGHFATSTAEFANVTDFYNAAHAHGLSIEALLMKPAGEYELYIHNPNGQLAIIYFNDHSPLREQLDHLVLFIDRMNSSAAHPVNFDSIDVRYGANIFYHLSS